MYCTYSLHGPLTQQWILKVYTYIRTVCICAQIFTTPFDTEQIIGNTGCHCICTINHIMFITVMLTCSYNLQYGYITLIFVDSNFCGYHGYSYRWKLLNFVCTIIWLHTTKIYTFVLAFPNHKNLNPWK